MSELSPDGRAFLEATRGVDEPTDIDRQRIRAKTLASIAAAGATGAVTAKAAAAAAGNAIAPSGWFGGALIGGLLAIGVLGVQTAFEIANAPKVSSTASAMGSAAPHMGAIEASDSRSAAIAPISSARPSSNASDSTAHAPLPSKVAPSVTVIAPPETSAAPEAPQTPTAHAMDDELAVLREAQEALRAGKPDDAVRALDRYGSSHAGGALEEERRAARIIASCAGHGPEARAEAERFLRERPDSPLRERIDAACSAKATP